ncbi:unnamed protein product [Cuscuta campestris]|uniref:AAA+ ATPase domain-containing protein n=1 Tax=Cuscuta campestris TaxID=132261 RepID=A0A484L3A3_9ASTE|nr:unnamed protein product [Cuscuta campestris]
MNCAATSLFASSALYIHPSPASLTHSNNKLRTRKLTVKASPKCNESRNLFRVRISKSRFRNLESSSFNVIGRNSSSTSLCNNDENLLNCIAKPIVYVLFCIGLGIFPVVGFRVRPAVAAPALVTKLFRVAQKGAKGKRGELEEKGHEYSHCTKSLLVSVSQLLSAVESVNSGKCSTDILYEGLDAVIKTREELQKQIMGGLYEKTKSLIKEKAILVQQKNEILKSLMKANGEGNSSARKAEGKDDDIIRYEEEYNRLLMKIDQIDDEISRREAAALNIGMRELLSIEGECVALVEAVLERIKTSKSSSMHPSPLTKLTRSEIRDELLQSQRQLQQERVFQNILENEYIGFDEETVGPARRIKQVLQESLEMQNNVESQIRHRMARYGDESKFVVNTPTDEVVKGYPDTELKWMFGKKEVVVPKAVAIHLYHGWKKWREEVKGDIKRNLLKDVDLGKKYVAERQERILLIRDRVVSKTWYNEKKHRWEMDPAAVPYAISTKLVASARIRHDWAVMFINLKGDDKEYYVDIKEFDMIFEEFGGFDELYLRMISSKIPIAVQLMWIPFLEWGFYRTFMMVAHLFNQCLAFFWNNDFVAHRMELVWSKVSVTTEDIMMMIVVPVLEFVIPYPVRARLGMAWPEYADQNASSSWYLTWLAEAEMNFRSRKEDNFWWYSLFLIRTVTYGSVLYLVVSFMRRKISRILGFGPIRRNPNFRKLRRVKAYFDYRTRKIKRMRRAGGIDPISTAFDQMKRIKNPPIRLRDFASVESMREEINEVVAFLQNPRAFQEMGARAPRGVLIVGEGGTGKTSLALAIAAESKVPVVEVKAQQLEGDLWVGQSASNVRELFQTARDLAPVIIFVEDFDLFAGVRGKFIHTKKQDHEAFINQLLVELDGFEKQDGVVLMATTRNLSQIDEALQRPGRMDRIFHLQRPTQAERENILKISAKESMDEELIDCVDWTKVAEKTALLRPIELKLVPVALEGSAFRTKFLDSDELRSYCSWFATCSGVIPKWVRKTRTAKRLAKIFINHLGLTLTKEDLDNVVDLMEPYGQISNGIEYLNPPLDWTRETKFPHAVWAAGRSLIALLLPNFDVVDNLWLEPFSWEGIGCTKITKARNEGSIDGIVESRSYLEKKLVFCFGSHVSAQLLLPFGEDNVLSASELKQAQEIATRMVIQYGWGPDDNPTIYHHGNAATTLSMGNNHEFELAAKVEKIYYLAYEKAKIMLQSNRGVLEKIVEELLEYEILTGKDLERIFAKNGGIREKEPFFLSSTHYDQVYNTQSVLAHFLEEGRNASPNAFLSAEI